MRFDLTMMIRRIACSLAIGVVATIAVCWLLAVTVAQPVGALSRPSGIGEGWSYWAGRGFGSLTVMRISAMFTLDESLRSDYLALRRREVPRWSAVHDPPTDDMRRNVTFIEEARGWPMLALRADISLTHAAQAASARSVKWGIVVARGDAQRTAGVVLPLRPIWSGLLMNSAMFGVIAFAVFFLPGIIRRERRSRAGRCVRCGYDLRASKRLSACPECGSASAGKSTG